MEGKMFCSDQPLMVSKTEKKLIIYLKYCYINFSQFSVCNSSIFFPLVNDLTGSFGHVKFINIIKAVNE